jgi:hypothetical protein
MRRRAGTPDAPGTHSTTFATAAEPSTIWLMANSDPNPHGMVHVHPDHPNHDALVGQMQRHLAEHQAHLNTTASYHKGVGVTGQDSQGTFSPGGASGAEYQTSSADSVGDADSGGPSGL